MAFEKIIKKRKTVNSKSTLVMVSLYKSGHVAFNIYDKVLKAMAWEIGDYLRVDMDKDDKRFALRKVNDPQDGFRICKQGGTVENGNLAGRVQLKQEYVGFVVLSGLNIPEKFLKVRQDILIIEYGNALPKDAETLFDIAQKG